MHSHPKLRLSLLVAVALYSQAFASSGGRSSPLPSARTAAPPKIDARLDDPCWQSAPVATGFSVLGSGGTRRAFRQTSLRTAHDSSALYFAVLCLEPDPASLVAKVTKRDGPVWLEDAVEVFIEPNPGSGRYFHFVFNANGVYYDALVDDAGWDAHVAVAAKRLDTHWQLEIAIPWKELNRECPAVGTEWGFNVAREHRPPARPQWSTWMPLEKGRKTFHAPKGFGRLRFVAAPVPGRLSFLAEEDALLANPDFDLIDEKGSPMGWSLKAGTKLAEIVPGTGLREITNASNYFIGGQKLDLAVKPGDTFTVVAVARAAGGAQMGIAVQKEMIDGRVWDLGYPFWKFPLTPRYTLYMRTHIIPPKVRRLVAFNLYRSNRKGRIWFDYVQLLRGAYGQAPIADLRKVFAGDRHPVGEPWTSPHLPLARPLAGGPLRALCFATRHLRDVAELAQRVELQYDLVHCPNARGARKCFTSYSYTPQQIVARLSGIGAAYHVVILAAKPTSPQLIDKLLNAVAAGTGLVYISPVATQKPADAKQWARLTAILPKAQPAAGQKHWILSGLPTLPLHTFAAGSHGKGRVVVLGYSEPTGGLIPPGTGRCRRWEYLHGLVARAAMWAACREPTTRIESAAISKDRSSLNVIITVDPSENAVECKLTCLWDHEKFPELDWQKAALTKSVKLGGEKTRVSFPVPQAARTASGLHVGTAILRDQQGRTFDWASAETTISPPVSITALKLERDTVRPNDRVSCDVTLSAHQPRSRLTLTAQLVDAFGRALDVAAQALDAPKGNHTCRMSVRMRAPLAVYHRFVVDLADADGPIDRRSVEVFAPTARADALDDFVLAAGYTAIPFSPPAYLQPAAIDFVRNNGLACIMPDVAAVRHGLVGFRSSASVYGVRQTGESHVRKTCFSDPANVKQVVDTTVSRIAGFRKWGFVGYTMVDETHLHQGESSEVCFSEHCKRRFRPWLKRFYKTLPDLNAAWGTDFKSWDAVEPALLADAAKRARPGPGGLPNLAQWVDFRRFMEHVWIGTFAEVQAAVKKRWPEARLSFTNPYKFGPLSGTNQWLMAQTEDILLKYFNSANTPRYRSYTNAPMVSWFGYHRSADDCRRFVWWFALNGGVMPIWWDPFEPWEYGGNRGLVAWQMFDPTWRPTGRSLAVTEAVRDLGRGIGKLLRIARRAQAQVAILHSQESMSLAYALDAAQPKGQKQMYKCWRASDDVWRSLLERNGIAYDYVAAEELRGEDPGFKWRAKIPGHPRTGLAALDGYKVLILPYTLALSDRSARAIIDFAASGGRVVCDVLAGVADEHGTPRRVDNPVAKLFGVRFVSLPKRGAETAVTFSNARRTTLRDATAPLQVQTLRPAGAASGAAVSETGPALFTNRHGKGDAVCLGFLPSKCPEAAALIAELLDEVKVQPEFVVANPDGSPAHDVETYVFELGASRRVAIVRDVKADSDVAAYKLSWRAPMHAYDSRAKRYLGLARSASVSVRRADAAFLSLLPYAVRRVRVAAADVTRGGTLTLTADVETDSGAAGDHVLHIELRAPDGDAPPAYRWNVVARNGRRELQAPVAFNDPLGQWEAVATDAASGVTGRAQFRIVK